MLASAFVARHRRVHSRGGDDAGGREENAPPPPASPYRCVLLVLLSRCDTGFLLVCSVDDAAIHGRTTRSRRRATQQDGPPRRSGGGGRRGRRVGVGSGAELQPPRRLAMAVEAEAAAEVVVEEAASLASSAVLCAVCLEDLRGKAAALPCSHAYYPGCVGPWLAVHRACPCCRAAVPVPPSPPHESADGAGPAS
ncbi:hypothetical protein PR202_gb13088 [Eleusine coracana subsp. coracana]|uniref:RING-type domain-containing protein n=1 Tax=Eleusine coracana subsp. coracana TaxID=191504 RepID=A0AAV5ERP7_ELECO|nr:hypothetical protein PR202_gb13088 [Eleusine coracana subsp. coracana]